MDNLPTARHHPSRLGAATTVTATALLLATFLSGCTDGSATPTIRTSAPPAPGPTAGSVPSEGQVVILSSNNTLPPGISELPSESGNVVSVAAYSFPAADNKFYLITWGSPGAGCHPSGQSYSVGPDGALTIVLHSSFDDQDNAAHPDGIICPASIGPVTDLVELPDTVTIPEKITTHPDDGIFPDKTVTVRDGVTE